MNRKERKINDADLIIQDDGDGDGDDDDDVDGDGGGDNTMMGIMMILSVSQSKRQTGPVHQRRKINELGLFEFAHHPGYYFLVKIKHHI